MPQALTVAELVASALSGEQHAWNKIVDRYMPLVSSVVSKYRLDTEDVQDVSQTVWLRLIEHLGNLREPRALPAWIVTTTRNEALRVVAARRRSVPFDPQCGSGLDTDSDAPEPDEELFREERHQALREGLTGLKSHHRELLLLLLIDPPPSYEEIGIRLGISVGSIGPTRARALDQLRATPALRDFLPSRQISEHRR